MSKWRPSDNCIYVIPDVHGRANELQLICNRILPLRHTEGIKDQIVFLGDYIDRGSHTPEVIDLLISLKEKYPEQIVFLRGNHEQMMLASLGLSSFLEGQSALRNWLANGGDITLLSYLKRAGFDYEHVAQVPLNRLYDFMPQDHLDFLVETQLYYQLEDYVFIHAGCEPELPMSEQNENNLLWNRKLFRRMELEGAQATWENTIITGHSHYGPVIKDKYMMLDCDAYDKLIVVELRSMEAYSAEYGNKRLIKLNLKP